MPDSGLPSTAHVHVWHRIGMASVNGIWRTLEHCTCGALRPRPLTPDQAWLLERFGPKEMLVDLGTDCLN